MHGPSKFITKVNTETSVSNTVLLHEAAAGESNYMYYIYIYIYIYIPYSCSVVPSTLSVHKKIIVMGSMSVNLTQV
jgi:hypothetical protein